MRKVTISLTSSTSAKDFFRRLIKQDSAIDILGVSLDWKFGSSDLEMIVDKLGRSNVKAFNLDLKDYNSVKKIKLFPTLQPGKGRYHSLLGLLSNTKLRGLSFTNLSMLSTRTSDLPSNQRPSLLQSFHFLQTFDREECPRLTNILYHCPGLVDLRLGSPRWESRFDISLHHMICSLKVLQSLHLYLVDKTFEDICDDLHLASLKTIKDLVYSVSYSAPLYLDPFHRQKWTSLEVLVFQGRNSRTQAFDLTLPSAQAYVAPLSSDNDISVCLSDQVRFSTLTHLDLSISLATESLDYIVSILPNLNLVHFGSGLYTNDLLKYVNVRSLKALSVEFQSEYDAQALVDLLRQNKDECQLDSLMLRCSSHMEVHLPDLLKCVPLKRLFLLISNKTTLEGMLRSLNYSRLQLLSIYCDNYDWSTEKIVAEKSMSFRSDLTVELGDGGNRNGRNVFSANSRNVQGTSASLARDQVVLTKTNYSNECLRFSLLAIPSNTVE